MTVLNQSWYLYHGASKRQYGMIMGRNAVLFILVLSLSYVPHALAMSAVTVKDYPACITREYLDDFVRSYNANDNGTVQYYLDTKRCIMMEGGVPVIVTVSPDPLDAKTAFVLNGVKLWTWRDGLTYAGGGASLAHEPDLRDRLRGSRPVQKSSPPRDGGMKAKVMPAPMVERDIPGRVPYIRRKPYPQTELPPSTYGSRPKGQGYYKSDDSVMKMIPK